MADEEREEPNNQDPPENFRISAEEFGRVPEGVRFVVWQGVGSGGIYRIVAEKEDFGKEAGLRQTNWILEFSEYSSSQSLRAGQTSLAWKEIGFSSRFLPIDDMCGWFLGELKLPLDTL